MDGFTTLTDRHYALRDLQSGKLVAVFVGSKSVGSKCGTLKIKADYGEEFFTMVILTIVGVYEIEKQKSGRITYVGDEANGTLSITAGELAHAG